MEQAIVPVKVLPKSSKNEVVGWEAGELKVRITAAPDKGKANEELCSYLAKLLGVAKSEISLHAGAKSRHKRLLLPNAAAEQLLRLFPR